MFEILEKYSCNFEKDHRDSYILFLKKVPKHSDPLSISIRGGKIMHGHYRPTNKSWMQYSSNKIRKTQNLIGL